MKLAKINGWRGWVAFAGSTALVSGCVAPPKVPPSKLYAPVPHHLPTAIRALTTTSFRATSTPLVKAKIPATNRPELSLQSMTPPKVRLAPSLLLPATFALSQPPVDSPHLLPPVPTPPRMRIKRTVAPREFYMVMPEDGGRVGTVVVTMADGREEVLHGAFASMRFEHGKADVQSTTAAVMAAKFGAAVASLPLAPTTVTLYFLSGKDEMTADSKIEADRVYRDFLRRGSPEIWIIGHTDSVGSESFNEQLSIKRAESVRQTLSRLGIPPANIVAKGMGKRQPRILTRDNTDEPLNRRVEISVR